MELTDIQITNLNREEILKKLAHFLSTGGWHHIATVNPEFIVSAYKNNRFKKILQTTHLNIADGFGLILATFITRQPRLYRITGADLIYDIIQLAQDHNKRVCLMGGVSGIAENARLRLLKKNPDANIVTVEAGTINYNEINSSWEQDSSLIPQIQSLKPDILLVALGHPKQELWLADHSTIFTTVSLAAGIGGSLDFLANKIPRAPLIWRKMGLEWLFRLIIEPTRLKRIYEAIIVFLVLIIKQHVFRKTIYLFSSGTYSFRSQSDWLLACWGT